MVGGWLQHHRHPIGGGAPQETVFVKNIDYDEKGRRSSISYGNNVKTRYTYDRETFRLLRLLTRRANGDILQDLSYTYDPVGNISEIEDGAIPDVFFRNRKVSGNNNYVYEFVSLIVCLMT